MAKATDEIKKDVEAVKVEVQKVEKIVLKCIANCYNGIREYKIGDEITTDIDTAEAFIKAKVAEKK